LLDFDHPRTSFFHDSSTLLLGNWPSRFQGQLTTLPTLLSIQYTASPFTRN
jgi:hypothetical protein